MLFCCHKELCEVGLNEMKTELLESSGQEMENFFHQFIDYSGDERIVESTRLSGDPSMEISQKFVCPERLCIFKLLDPQFYHFSNILKSFFDLSHFIKRFPFVIIVGVPLDNQTCSFSVFLSQFLGDGYGVDCQVFHGDLNAIVAINTWVQNFSCEYARLIGGYYVLVEIVPPSNLISRMKKSAELNVGDVVEQCGSSL